MAHEIDMSAGYAAAAFARKPAWHGLGKVLPDFMSGDEAIDAAGLGWSVSLRPVYRPNKDGDLILEKDRRCVVRDDTDKVLGHVGSTFVPLQNWEQIDFLDGLLGKGAKIESAGSLRDGKRVWFLVDLKATYEPIGGDPVENYLLLLNGHDGLTCWCGIATGVRVVCANTLAIAMDSADKRFGKFVKLRHDGRMEENIRMAEQTLLLTKEAVIRAEAEAKALARTKVSVEGLAKFFAETVYELGFPKERSEMVVAEMYAGLEAPTNSLPGMRGTAWQAINVVTEWVDHSPRKMSNDVRMESVWAGEMSRLKQNAWQRLLAVAV